MHLLRASLALLLTLGAQRADAHAFTAGADGYAQFLEGSAVILAHPPTLLPLVALGILLTLWQPEGFLRVWPIFLAGQVAGFGFGPVAEPWVSGALLATGLVTAGLAALLPRHVRAESAVLAALAGLLAIAVSLEGHGFLELAPMTYAGIFVAANLALALSAGIVRVSLERVTVAWMRIAARVAASWIGAMLALMLALSLNTA